MTKTSNYYPEYIVAYETDTDGNIITISMHSVQTPTRKFYAELNTRPASRTSVFGQMSAYNSDAAEMSEEFAIKGDILQIRVALEKWCDEIVSGTFTLYAVGTRWGDDTTGLIYMNAHEYLFKNTTRDMATSHHIHLYTDILKAYGWMDVPVQNVVHSILAQGIKEASKQRNRVPFQSFDNTDHAVRITDNLYEKASFVFKPIVIKGELILEASTIGMLKTGDMFFEKNPSTPSFSGIMLSKHYEGMKTALKTVPVNFLDGSKTYQLPDVIIKSFNDIGELVYPGQKYLAPNYQTWCEVVE